MTTRPTPGPARESSGAGRMVCRRPFLSAMLCAVLAGLIITATFREGQRRGMDHMIEALDNHQWAIAITLSDNVYHLNAGYVGYRTVLDKLTQVWYRGGSVHDETFYENNKNKELMDEAIRTAASLGPQQPGFVGDRSLITMIYSDLGIIDFDKLAFRLFGLRIESFYYMFFLLLTVSALAWLVTFWSDMLAKIVLLCALFAFFVELQTPIFSTPHMPTFPGMRHGSTLALIPALHFALLLVSRRKISVLAVLAAAVQLAILLLAIATRGSATWTLFFIPAVAIGLAYLDWRGNAQTVRRWSNVARTALQWPVLLLFLGVFVYGQYVKASLHPVYFTDDVVPYHPIWHTAYAGILQAEFSGLPGFVPPTSKVPEVVAKIGNLDIAGYVAAAEYLRDSHFIPPPADLVKGDLPPSFISPWTGTLKFKFNDDIMRRVVLQTWAAHPLLSLRLYAIFNPWSAVTMLYDMIVNRPHRIVLWLIFLGGVGGFALTWIGFGALPREGYAKVLVPVALAVPFAAMPNIWGYAQYHTIADLLLVGVIFLQIAVCGLVIAVGRAGVAAWWRRKKLAYGPATTSATASSGAGANTCDASAV